MGLYDDYIPDPPLNCPVCGSPLEGWQGYDGPNGLMVWRQGVPAPIDQPIDEDAKLDPEELARSRLPKEFTIHAPCCGKRFFVEAKCTAPNGTWSTTEVVTAETAKQRKDERRADFQERLRWLSGRA